MKLILRRRPSPAMVVACLALFVALGGSALAAAPLITGAQINNGSVTGRDLRNNSVKGADVAEASLGRVPSAATALTAQTASSASAAASAANADRLDGKDSSQFLENGATAAGDLSGTYPNPALRNGSVTGAKILANAVGTAHVSANALDVVADTDVEVVSDSTDFPSIAGHACEFRGLSFPGSATWHVLVPVDINLPDGLVIQEAHGQTYGGWMMVCNTTASAIDPGPTTFTFLKIPKF
jgi:hypothetical protein